MPDDLTQHLLSSVSSGTPPSPFVGVSTQRQSRPVDIGVETVKVAVPHPLVVPRPPPRNLTTPSPILPAESAPSWKGEAQRGVFKKVVLVILDGFGVASKSYGNAVAHASAPTLDFLVANFPALTLQASGPLVGLPWGEMGNSEVGHLNIGAGRIVGQDLPRITASIQNGQFFKNPVLLEAIMHATRHNSKLHLMGLVSSGGVHSLDEHLYALLALAADRGLSKVYVHYFTDGRDTMEKVALEDIKKLRNKIGTIGVGEIATITGRFYAMDRGGHWNQTMLTYEALVNGKGEKARSAEDCIWRNYQSGVYDEMIKPTVINRIGPEGDEHPTAVISDNDAVIFFNFRPDRAVQLTQAFVAPQSLPPVFQPQPIKNLYFVTMTQYIQDLPVKVAFPPIDLRNCLAEVLAKNNKKQFHISESEKYAHVTSFFDCGRGEPFSGEERKIVASPDNARNYVDYPEMSAELLTDILIAKIADPNVTFFVANFANADMVGHTGSLKSATRAVEVLDAQLKKIMDTCLETGAVLIITADHGNIEEMINLRTGEINKDHTTNPVPFLLVAKEFQFPTPKPVGFLSLAARMPDGAISDIAPTVLELLGMEKPKEMTGMSLLNVVNDHQNVEF